MRRILMLGTGTGVGKTYVTAALARALAKSGPRSSVMAIKPIETGFTRRGRSGAPPRGSDAAALEAASTTVPRRPHPLLLFADPVSPHLAARRTGQRISITRVLRWIDSNDVALPRTTLRCPSWQIIETAGGALSPLGRATTNLDLARALDPSIWILVAHDGLGVLHDVRAAWLAMSSLGRSPDFLVLSASRNADASSGANARELKRVGLPAPIAVIARDAPDCVLAPLVGAVRRWGF